MTAVRPTITTLVDQARAADSASGATITRSEAVGILATAREMHLNRHDVETALAAAGFADPASLRGDVARRAREDEGALSSLGYRPGVIDGRGDATLEAAVRRFQHDYALPETGAVDPAMRQLLQDMVAANQAMLAAIGPAISVDGVAGPETTNAVRAFQREHHLPVTGVCDERTTNALGTAYQQDRDRGDVDRAWATTRVGEVRAQVVALGAHSPVSFEQLTAATRDQLSGLVDAGVISRELAHAAAAYSGLTRAIRNFDNGGPGASAMLHMMHEANDSAARLGGELSTAFTFPT